MSFDDEMESVKGSGLQRMTRQGVFVVTIRQFRVSETHAPDYQGCPYLEFFLVDEINNTCCWNRFWRERDAQDPKAEGKRKLISDFLNNAGADSKLKGAAWCQSAVGKQVQGLFRIEEYISYDKKHNHFPSVAKKVALNFSAPLGKTVTGNQKYFYRALSDKDQTAFEQKYLEWTGTYGDPPTSTVAVTPVPTTPPNTGTPPVDQSGRVPPTAPPPADDNLDFQ